MTLKKIPILFYICLVACTQIQTTNDVTKFNELLGVEKAEAFNEAVLSFKEFLKVNYPEIEEENQRINQFLQTLMDTKDFNFNFKFDVEKCARIIEKWEKSDLRKEVWLYGNEDYTSLFWSNTGEELEEEIIPITRNEGIEVETVDISKYLDSNSAGLYLYGLSEYAPNDTIIQEYVDMKKAIGDISSKTIAESIKKLKIKYNEPFFMRILVVEFYYDLMKYSLEGERNNAHQP